MTEAKEELMPERSGQYGYRLRGLGAGANLEFVLQKGANWVGAIPGSEITIRELGVSKRHAVVRWDGDVVIIEDLGSKNGTFLNGQSITTAVIRPGDLVGFGPMVFSLETNDPEEAEVALPFNPLGQAGGVSPDRKPASLTTASLSSKAVPERWLSIIAHCAGHVITRTETGVSRVLESLASGIGVRGVVLADWRPPDELTVRSIAGAVQPAELFDRVRESLNPPPDESVDHGRDVAVNFLEGDPPLVVASATRSSTGTTVLVVAGDFPTRSESGHLVEAVFRLVQVCSKGARRGISPPAAISVPDLVFPPSFVVGCSEAAKGILRQLRHLVRGNLPVLITGETGVGKEHIARIIHASSDRCSGPFVAVNCAAIPSELMEAELFGIEKGVATGVEKREGRFQLAHSGVIFLDEIGDMPPPLQSKVLRALQDQLIWPVGARQATPVDVRVISSTNRDLTQRMNEGLFRPDLYYRIAGYELPIPPLRERKDDIPLLVDHFMQCFAQEAGKMIRGVSAKALEALSEAPWPGNVRELGNEVRRLVYVCPEGQPITSAMLSSKVVSPLGLTPASPKEGSELDLADQMEDRERQVIVAALAQTKGNRSWTARLLGISRNGLANKMRRLGLDAGK